MFKLIERYVNKEISLEIVIENFSKSGINLIDNRLIKKGLKLNSGGQATIFEAIYNNKHYILKNFNVLYKD